MEKKTLYAVIAVLALGLSAVLVLRSPEKGQRVGPPPRPIPQIKAAEITGLELTTEKKEKVVLEKQPGSASWRLKSPGDHPADPQIVKSVTEGIEKLGFGDQVTEGTAKHDELGVSDDKATHLVVKSGSKTLADLRIGKSVGGYTMVRVAGKSEVWQGAGIFPYMFNREGKAFRDHTVFEFPIAEVEKLTIESGHDKLVLEKLAPEKDKPNETKWKIAQAEGQAPRTDAALDQAMATGAAQAMSSLRASDFADGKGLGDVGLDHPVMTVTAQTKGKPRTLLIGSSSGDDTYVKPADGPTVYVLKKYTIERVAHRPVDYRDKTLVKAKENDIAQVEVTSGAQTTSLEHAGDKWKAKKGNFDDAKVKALVAAFENVSGSGFATSKDAKTTGLAKPAGSVTVRLKDKSSVTLKIGALTSDKSDYFVQKVGAPEVYLVKKWTVDRLLKKPADLEPTKGKTAAAPPPPEEG